MCWWVLIHINDEMAEMFIQKKAHEVRTFKRRDK